MKSATDTKGEAELKVATSAIRVRAWHDFIGVMRSHQFNFVLALMSALGAGIGALAPSDASSGRRFLTAALAALLTSLIAYLVALIWSFVRAPFRQRRELIEHLTTSDPLPIMVMEPAIDIRNIERPIFDDKTSEPEIIQDRLFIAFVRVYNAQDLGGEKATAQHITPEVEIFAPGDRLVFHYKGWDTIAWRDFTASQEEHALWLAAKWESESGCFVTRGIEAKPLKSLPDNAYSIKVTSNASSTRAPLPPAPHRSPTATSQTAPTASKCAPSMKPATPISTRPPAASRSTPRHPLFRPPNRNPRFRPPNRNHRSHRRSP